MKVVRQATAILTGQQQNCYLATIVKKYAKSREILNWVWTEKEKKVISLNKELKA